MSHIYAAIGSVTAATRFVRELNRMGIRAAVVHTPAEINSGGCSYSVRVDERYSSELEAVARMKNYRLKRMYKVEKGEVFVDIP